MLDSKEMKYFQKTITKLNEAYEQLTKDISIKDRSYKDLQKFMIDYNSELDKFEVYDYQQTLSMIDKRGFAQVNERQQLAKLIDSPYFGKFNFVYAGEAIKDAEAFYIGRFGFSDEEGNALIYDWRAPVCNMYYEFELGEASYEAKGRRFYGEIIAKKQFKIERSKIEYIVDSSITIQDEVLQQTLNQHANDKMKTIVTSIQREQNKIVRNESAFNVIIQGVAGSGKTAVALHRIAYLLYKYRDTLKAERIFILSPNKVFGDYISSVLPELGEQPIRSFTMDELTAQLMPSSLKFMSFEQEVSYILANPTSDYAKRTAIKSNYQFVKRLQRFLQEQSKTMLKNQSVTIADYDFTDEYLQRRFMNYVNEPVLNRLELMAEDILQVLKGKRNGELKLPSKNEIVKRLKKRLQHNSALSLYEAFMEQVGQEGFHFKNKCFEFNDVYPYLYCQLFFEGIKTYELVQHFVLDEMQDYTPIQYAVLEKVFACKRTIIGDFSQALLPFETITKEAFLDILMNSEYVELTTSYRSSYEIAMYAKQFMRNSTINPIERHGEKPVEMYYNSTEEMLQQIRQAIKNSFKTTAIICKTVEDLSIIKQHLHDQAFHVLDGQSEVFEAGVVLTTIQYAKGLEFDAVIVPFVTNSNYMTTFDQGLLYIATTRAMHNLTMLVDAKDPSTLLM